MTTSGPAGAKQAVSIDVHRTRLTSCFIPPACRNARAPLGCAWAQRACGLRLLVAMSELEGPSGTTYARPQGCIRRTVAGFHGTLGRYLPRDRAPVARLLSTLGGLGGESDRTSDTSPTIGWDSTRVLAKSSLRDGSRLAFGLLNGREPNGT